MADSAKSGCCTIARLLLRLMLSYVLEYTPSPHQAAPVPADFLDFRLPNISLRFMLLRNIIPGADWLTERTMQPTTAASLEVLAAGAPQESMPEVVFWSTWVYTNYYHMFAEFMPTLHATLCKYLGEWGRGWGGVQHPHGWLCFLVGCELGLHLSPPGTQCWLVPRSARALREQWPAPFMAAFSPISAQTTWQYLVSSPDKQLCGQAQPL